MKISTVNSKEDHRGSFSQRPKVVLLTFAAFVFQFFLFSPLTSSYSSYILQSPQIQIILGKAENLNKITTAADAAAEPKMESDKQA